MFARILSAGVLSSLNISEQIDFASHFPEMVLER